MAGLSRPRGADYEDWIVPIADGSGGGGYQYSLAFLEALAVSDRDDTYVIIAWHDEVPGTALLLERGANVHVIEPPKWRTMLKGAANTLLGPDRTAALRRRVAGGAGGSIGGPGRFATNDVASLGLDLIIELGYTGFGIATGIPFALPIHDIQHRLQPEFPEVGTPQEWESREAFLTQAIAKASVILVDSEVGRADLLVHYPDHIDEERITVLPFVPAPYLAPANVEDVARTRNRYSLPLDYLLFPAQFWPHKNHARVVEAMAQPANEETKVVMTGGGGDEYRDQVLAEVRGGISAHGLEERIQIIGHVPDAEMASLYCGARGVILPTFFGPTNIPVVEAWSLGIPVLTSDTPGIREQAGAAAILVNPRSVDSIARGMATLWSDAAERDRLVAEGRRRLQEWTPLDFAHAVSDMLDRLEHELPAASRESPS